MQVNQNLLVATNIGFLFPPVNVAVMRIAIKLLRGLRWYYSSCRKKARRKCCLEIVRTSRKLSIIIMAV